MESINGSLSLDGLSEKCKKKKKDKLLCTSVQ